jgi:ferredoxin-NADP reductase
MARAAVPGGLKARRVWRPGVLVDRRQETDTAHTLVFEVADWPGHLAGQHVDVRLTADDGYQASRSYSLAAPADGDRIEITVQRLADGEVSPFLADDLAAGDALEVRGPLGGWFVWRPEDPAPVLLVAGGSGVVPLMAMIRARAGASRTPFRLVYSVRTPEDRIYAAELRRRASEDGGLDVAWVHTRTAPDGDPRPAGRLSAEDLVAHGWPPDFEPTCYVCGPTGFVEAAAALLIAAGHDPARIRTERFGGS